MNTFCHYYNQKICSSCSQIETPYPSQVENKELHLKSLLAPLGSYQALPPVTSRLTHFRNKAKLIVTGPLSEPIIGLTGVGELDQGRDIQDCPLHHPRINEVIKTLPAYIQLTKLVPYQIKQKTGEIKGVILYYSHQSKTMYLRLVLRSKESIDRLRKNLPSLLEQHSFIKCVSVNIQPIPHAILEGEEEIFLTDETFIQHDIGAVSMTLSPQGFVQTNQEIAQKLYETAASWVKETQAQKFLELFSGQGAFSFFIQEHVSEALGVEINPGAVERANQTAKAQHLDHLRFVAKDASQVLLEIQKMKADVLLVNPPRRGLGESLKLVEDSEARYLIYSSCNSETLAKDLLALKDTFQVQRVQLFDMFPHTEHYETLVLLKSIAGAHRS